MIFFSVSAKPVLFGDRGGGGEVFLHSKAVSGGGGQGGTCPPYEIWGKKCSQFEEKKCSEFNQSYEPLIQVIWSNYDIY